MAPAPTSSVLVFHMARRMSPALLGLDQAFRATLNDAVAGPPTIYAEYLELAEFDDDALVQDQLATYLGAKYLRIKLDVIAVTSSRALRFVLRAPGAHLPRGGRRLRRGGQARRPASSPSGRRVGGVAVDGLGRHARSRAAATAGRRAGRGRHGLPGRRPGLEGDGARPARAARALRSRSPTSTSYPSKRLPSGWRRCPPGPWSYSARSIATGPGKTLRLGSRRPASPPRHPCPSTLRSRATWAPASWGGTCRELRGPGEAPGRARGEDAEG